ncbi:MAG: DUF3303 domain-containing protein [Planctomycetes bacterium]|nr:DUF3303 domain-containing protein [Planctomycetota bacterium]
MKYRIFWIFVFTIIISCSSLSANDKDLKWPSDSTNKGTLYVAHWTHTADNCPGRSSDGAKMLNSFWEGRKKAEEKGIKILGAYVTVTEHDYFILIEASDYAAVVEFFLPLIPSQTGKIVPVLTMDDWLKIMPK